MLHDHVNVLNGLALKHLQTVKMENFILRVFYHNFYLKKLKRRKKETHRNPWHLRFPRGCADTGQRGDTGSPGHVAGKWRRRAAVSSWVLILPRPSEQAGG